MSEIITPCADIRQSETLVSVGESDGMDASLCVYTSLPLKKHKFESFCVRRNSVNFMKCSLQQIINYLVHHVYSAKLIYKYFFICVEKNVYVCLSVHVYLHVERGTEFELDVNTKCEQPLCVLMSDTNCKTHRRK